MNTNTLVKIAKWAGFLLPALGGFAAAYANSEESKQAVIKTAEKIAKEHINKK